ncbi:MAG: DUF2953 domain-containing protein [Oscillospiraceae bacterium]|nr:DUF2953 domain-containing protein [Oscillospiraceae bacterium]
MIVLWWILGIIGFLVLLVTILLFAPLRLQAEVKDGDLTATVKILGIKYVKKMDAETPIKKTGKKAKKEVKEETQDEKASIREKIHDVRRKIQMVREILQEVRAYLSTRLIFESLTLKLRFGDGNAARTGIETGLIWGAAGGLVALLNNNFIVKTPIDVEIMPEFNQKMFDLYVNGIIRTRLAHIIIAAFIAVKVYRKYDEI